MIKKQQTEFTINSIFTYQFKTKLSTKTFSSSTTCQSDAKTEGRETVYGE